MDKRRGETDVKLFNAFYNRKNFWAVFISIVICWLILFMVIGMFLGGDIGFSPTLLPNYERPVEGGPQVLNNIECRTNAGDFVCVGTDEIEEVTLVKDNVGKYYFQVKKSGVIVVPGVGNPITYCNNIKKIKISTRGGRDTIRIRNCNKPAVIHGGNEEGPGDYISININARATGEDPNRIYGGKGDDEIEGSNYYDVICGNEGKDNIYSYERDDKIDGGDDTDTINVGTGIDIALGGKPTNLPGTDPRQDKIVGCDNQAGDRCNVDFLHTIVDGKRQEVKVLPECILITSSAKFEETEKIIRANVFPPITEGGGPEPPPIGDDSLEPPSGEDGQPPPGGAPLPSPSASASP